MGKQLISPFLFILLLSLILTGCGQVPIPQSVAPAMAPMQPTGMAAMGMTQTMRPSNPGGAGPALDLKGDPQRGAQVFANCVPCHPNQGKGGVANPGSTDGRVPALNPIDSAMGKQDPEMFASTLDLFIEHGSTPNGPNPTLKMPAWGDSKALSPQQIADVIAYVMSLNQ